MDLLLFLFFETPESTAPLWKLLDEFGVSLILGSRQRVKLLQNKNWSQPYYGWNLIMCEKIAVSLFVRLASSFGTSAISSTTLETYSKQEFAMPWLITYMRRRHPPSSMQPGIALTRSRRPFCVCVECSRVCGMFEHEKKNERTFHSQNSYISTKKKTREHFTHKFRTFKHFRN